MTNTAALRAQLETIPPNSTVTITWQTPDGTTQTDGQLVTYDPNSAARRIEATDSTLILVPAEDGSEISVAELTDGQTTFHGELCKLSVKNHAIEPLEITEQGVDVPTYLVGYTGFLVVEDDTESHELRIPEPGLEAYDDRLVAHCSNLTNTNEIRVRPRAGPHRRYELIDTRMDDEMTADDPPRGDYEGLETVIHTVAALNEAVTDDDELADSTQTEARRCVQDIQTALLNARDILCDPQADPDWQPTAEDGDPITSYHTTLDQLQSDLERFETEAIDETGCLERRQCHLKFSSAQWDVDELYSLLCTASTEVPPRGETAGRQNGDGRWLEHQLRNSLQRWGYRTQLREKIHGLEIDVIARREPKQDDPTDWIVAQCKDWESRPITPDVIFRLCMLAFTCKAMPVLCHTTRLTDRAKEIANKWEVRVLKLEDLNRGALPAPATLALSDDLISFPTTYTARKKRNPLPILFCDEPNKHFTYVPGYEPVGRTHKYRPVDERD